MGRKRTDDGDVQIATLVRAGRSADAIYEALRDAGLKISRATVGRRVRELRGKVRVGRVASAPKKTKTRTAAPPRVAPPVDEPPVDSGPDLPGELEEIPEGLSIQTMQRLLVKADRAAQAAHATGDLATFGAMVSRVTNLSEAIRKATPPEPPDPNERPDMIAAAARAREMLHRLVDKVAGIGVVADPPKASDP